MNLSICIFSAQYKPHLGGITNFTENLSQALNKLGNDIVIVTNDTSNSGQGISTENGIEIVRLPCIPLVGGRLPLPVYNSNMLKLRRHLDSKHFDAVLINARFYFHTLYGTKFARKHNIRPIVLDHGSDYIGFSNTLLDPLVHRYEDVITAIGKRRSPDYYGISAASVSWLEHFGIKAEGVLSNSIDAEKFRDQASERSFRDELGIADSRFLIAFLARLIPEKGVDAVIAASKDPEITRRNIVFAIAGDGPLADDVKSAESPTLRYLGKLDRPDVASLFLQADALCLPSRSEGFATTLLEASACGLPSIVTSVGGAKELIPSPDYGTIIPDRSSEAVISAVCKLADNQQLKQLQSQNCRQLVEQNYSWEASAQRVEHACKHAMR